MRFRRKRIPPKPAPHPLLGEAHLCTDYKTPAWCYRLPMAGGWECIWADGEGRHSEDYIRRGLADYETWKEDCRKRRDARARLTEWYAAVKSRLGDEGSAEDLIRYHVLGRVLEILDGAR